ncbi:MAG: hypothetical protein HC769_14070 [Cyanobacteria bacterium CRU_2_1]|nr:hypothetical protein [Cyanobacteria bacterium RU_5_0]NJR59859.1 hypothetical protein [Cyanobacteria bacterium CRU_2_1]
MKSLKILALVLVFTLPSLPASADRDDDGEACYSVDAKRGWQHIYLAGPFSRVLSIDGTWTADLTTLDRVGAEGYVGEESFTGDYSGLQYDEDLPLGALLIGVPGASYSLLNTPQDLTQPIINVAMRINDNDLNLGDNLGSLRVCFGN